MDLTAGDCRRDERARAGDRQARAMIGRRIRLGIVEWEWRIDQIAAGVLAVLQKRDTAVRRTDAVDGLVVQGDVFRRKRHDLCPRHFRRG